MFTALAEGFGNFNDKINVFIALAPVAYVGDSEANFWLKGVS